MWPNTGHLREAAEMSEEQLVKGRVHPAKNLGHCLGGRRNRWKCFNHRRDKINVFPLDSRARVMTTWKMDQ